MGGDATVMEMTWRDGVTRRHDRADELALIRIAYALARWRMRLDRRGRALSRACGRLACALYDRRHTTSEIGEDM